MKFFGSSSGVISFCFFIWSMVFSWQEYWSGGVVCHPLLQWTLYSQFFTMTYPTWVALHGMAHSFIELPKPLCHNKAMIHEGFGQPNNI